jgi:hypothetical protein
MRTFMKTGTIAAAALLAAGCSAAGPVSAPLPPSSASSPPASPAPSLTSTSTSSSSPSPSVPASARPIPSSIPAAAFLQAADAPGKAKDKPRRLGAGEQPLPSFCGHDYGQRGKVGVRATQNLLYVEADAPAEATPKSTVYEDVLVFQGDAATAFMTGLRAAVQGCASQKDDSGVTVRNYLRGDIKAGDDSVLIERTRPATDEAGEPVGGGALHHLYWAAVRVGDAVAFVSNTGWESVSADRADTVHLGGKAAARLSAWRG